MPPKLKHKLELSETSPNSQLELKNRFQFRFMSNLLTPQGLTGFSSGGTF